MQSICVYLGAKPGNVSFLAESTIRLGRLLAEREIRLIYGGSSHGLMGELASAVMRAGGQVTGIMPAYLMNVEQPLDAIDELIITENMQERKILMQQKADAFIVMPGGIGTLEEAFETWNAIKTGVINKPLGFLNLNNYYDNLFLFVNQCEEQGFVTEKQLQIPLIDAEPENLLNALERQFFHKQENSGLMGAADNEITSKVETCKESIWKKTLF